jgi:DNA-binding HxlR family transcriptional regulator
MHAHLAGQLSRRGGRPLGSHCPIDRAVQAVGSRSAVLLLREAYYGATRFDDFVARTGLTDATVAGRLKSLVEVGVLDKVPYQEPGKRRRYEYGLTDSGQALVPVVFALAQWGRAHLPKADFDLSHRQCGSAVSVELRCASGHEVALDELSVSA